MIQVVDEVVSKVSNEYLLTPRSPVSWQRALNISKYKSSSKRSEIAVDTVDVVSIDSLLIGFAPALPLFLPSPASF